MPRLLPRLALAAILPGCVLSGAPDDLFPVCEDRRAQGPSPTYTLDRLAALTDEGDLSAEEERQLLSAVRTRVLTLQGASYRSFDATLTPVEGQSDAWWFEARGVGGITEDWDDAYRLRLVRGGESVQVLDPRPMPYPARAPQTIERLALEIYARTEDFADVRNRTPTLAAAGLDPDLPACVFLSYEGEPAQGRDEPARTQIAVNVVGMRVVHVSRVGW